MLWVWACLISLTPLILKVNACWDVFISWMTVDLYMLLWDEESKSLWVIASPTCSPKPTQKACFPH